MQSLSERTFDSNLAGVQQLEEPLTLEASAYRELRRVITDGVLRPGDRVSINALAQRMGVSRLPVIHALRRLASEGFVQMRPHRNAIVTKPTQKDIRARVLMMSALEEIAVREGWPLPAATVTRMGEVHAKSKAQSEAEETADDWDRLFHEMVWQASGVEQLTDMIQTLWDLGAYYRTMMNRRREVVESRAVEHTAILRAFQDGTVEDAVASIRLHRLKALERINRMFLDEIKPAEAILDGARRVDAAP